MKAQIRPRPGAVHSIGELVELAGAQSLFLVTGRSSYAASGAEASLARALKGKAFSRFSVSGSYPRLDEVERGLECFRRAGADLIIAVGGGKVLDTAKLIAILSAQSASPAELVRGYTAIDQPGPPVMAIPTTAGTGSEVTHFAVVYVGDAKYSLAHPSMRPAYAVVDPELTYSLPAKTTAVTGLDTFSQAVESLWAVQARTESIDHASRAIRLVLEHLPRAVHEPSPRARGGMSEASHLAGKAIDISKTTAPHALSYTMTSQFHVPHGHAAALTLAPMLLYNSHVTETDAASPRAVEQVHRAIDELNGLLACRDASASALQITRFIASLGLATRLSDVGIRSAADRRRVVEGVNTERLRNNPRRLTPDALAKILEEVA